MQLIRRDTRTTHRVLLDHVPTAHATRRALRALFATWAACLYGTEGRDWRIVQDHTGIGLHVRALGAYDGETLELL